MRVVDEFPYTNLSAKERFIHAALICTVTVLVIILILFEIVFMNFSVLLASKITENDIGKAVLIIMMHCIIIFWFILFMDRSWKLIRVLREYKDVCPNIKRDINIEESFVD